MIQKATATTTKLVKGVRRQIFSMVISFDSCLGVCTDQITPYHHVTEFVEETMAPIKKVVNAVPTSNQFKNANSTSLQKKNYGKRAKNKH